MFFVCLIADPSHDNPVKTLGGRERRDKAARIAGYQLEPDGKRLDKNGRLAATGQIASIETAIEKFKELHYNQKQRSIDALKKQISEFREFLESDKTTILTNRKGEPVLNAKGEQTMILDPKLMELAMKIGKELPALEEGLDKLEANNKEDVRYEGKTFTSADVELGDDFPDDQDAPAIEKFHLNQKS